ATVSMAIHGLSGTASDGGDDIIYLYSTDETAVFGTTSNESRAIHFHGMVRTTSGNGGTFRLRWAKYSSSGSLEMYSNSFMYARRLAYLRAPTTDQKGDTDERRGAHCTHFTIRHLGCCCHRPVG